MIKLGEKETESGEKTMKELLTAVTKILSSTYCILVVAIYVVIVVNRFTHFTPENHYDVEVRKGVRAPPDITKIFPALPSVHLPDVGVERVPVIPAGVPHPASEGTPEQEVSWQRLSQARSCHLWSGLSSLLHL